jgi:hypothetical protein
MLEEFIVFSVSILDRVMEPVLSVQDLAELVREEEALRIAVDRLRLPGLPRLRGAARSAVAERIDIPEQVLPVPRYALAGRCTQAGRKRLTRLGWLEGRFPEDFDHTALVLLGCQAIEAELIAVVAEPARVLGPSLPGAIADRASRTQINILERWLEGRAPATLGTLEIVLFALRRGLVQRLPEVVDFLGRRFLPEYADLLQSNGLGRAVSKVRNDFRNPAAHGLRDAFPAEDYRRLCALGVGAVSVGSWLREGPEPEPPVAEEGVLHHHLAQLPGDIHATGTQGGVDPREALLSLRTPAESTLRVRLSVERVSVPVTVRTVAVRPTGGGTSFQVGESIRFVVQVEEPCRFLLLDLAAGKKATVLFPNALRPDSQVAAGTLSLPDRAVPEWDFLVEGPPGEDAVLAIATREPLPLTLLPADGREVMRGLSVQQLAALADALRALPADSWAVDGCKFAVTK